MANCKECVHFEMCRRIDYELEYHNKSIKEAEEELPIKCRFFKNKTDVVPVVRCKDCKWFYKPNLLCTHKRNRVFNTGIKRDFNCYCNYGERKCE